MQALSWILVIGFCIIMHVILSFLASIPLAVGYSLLGSTRLILKKTKISQNKMFRASYISSLLLMLFIFTFSIYPYIIPYKITFWQAASPDNTLRFMLVGSLIVSPILLVYTSYAYEMFGGKVNEITHY